MPKPAASDQRAYAEAWNRRLVETAQLLAYKQGAPPSSSALSEADELRYWMVEDAAAAERARAEGRPEAEVALARWPLRPKVYRNGRPRLRDQVEHAERMDRLAQRAWNEQAAQEPPRSPSPLGGSLELDHALNLATDQPLAPPSEAAGSAIDPAEAYAQAYGTDGIALT